MAGLLFFILYLYFFVNISEMIAAIYAANLFYYAIAGIATVLSVTLHSLTWQFFLGMLHIKVAFRKIIAFVWAGIFVDLIVPAEAVSGDITKIYLMTKNMNEESVGKIVASVMSSRIISMVVTLGGLVSSSIFLLFSYPLPQMVLTFVVIVIIYSAAAIILLSYLCFKEATTWRIINWTINFFERLFRHRWSFSDIRSQAKKTFEAFREGIGLLVRNPKGLTLPLVSSFMAWFFDVLTVLLVFYALEFNISFLEIVIIYSLMLSIQAIPLGIPAEVGLTEIVMTSLFATLGVPISVSAAATILTRILAVWFKIIIGYIAIQWVGIKALKTTSKL